MSGTAALPLAANLLAEVCVVLTQPHKTHTHTTHTRANDLVLIEEEIG